ncbi:hypothetical protein, partial [Streptomyces noursei]
MSVTDGCLTCIHRDRDELEADLEAGYYTPAGAAAAYGLPAADVRGHIDHCGARVAEACDEPLDDADTVMRSVLATCQVLRDIVIRSQNKPGQAVRAIAELIKLLDMRARITGALAQPGVH